MRLVTRTPSPALAPFVSRLWWFEGTGLAHQRERVLPSTTTEVLVNLDEDATRWWIGAQLATPHRARGGIVRGVSDTAFAIDTAEQRRLVGAVVRPGAAPALRGAAADAFASRHVELAALWGAPGATLREHTTPGAVLDALDAFLLAQLRGSLDPVIARARHALEGRARVASVADEVGYSPKRLRARFAAAVGVTPKRYARIARLQRVLAASAKARRVDGAELALGCGYYDQARLIAEFRALTGLTPSADRPRAEDDHHHVVLARGGTFLPIGESRRVACSPHQNHHSPAHRSQRRGGGRSLRQRVRRARDPALHLARGRRRACRTRPGRRGHHPGRRGRIVAAARARHARRQPRAADPRGRRSRRGQRARWRTARPSS